MRSAKTLVEALSKHHGSISPWAFGLLTGLAVTYARPFAESRGKSYGRIGSKWSKFPTDRPELKMHHDRLIDLRKKLLAHTDETQYRRVAVFTRSALFEDRPHTVEGRSPINAPGMTEVLELLEFQEARINTAIAELATRLQDLGYWPDGALLELDASGGFTVIDPSQQEYVDTDFGTSE
jgi:hypothetical protein